MTRLSLRLFKSTTRAESIFQEEMLLLKLKVLFPRMTARKLPDVPAAAEEMTVEATEDN